MEINAPVVVGVRMTTQGTQKKPSQAQAVYL
jgi:hypothetical protein